MACNSDILLYVVFVILKVLYQFSIITNDNRCMNSLSSKTNNSIELTCGNNVLKKNKKKKNNFDSRPVQSPDLLGRS